MITEHSSRPMMVCVCEVVLDAGRVFLIQETTGLLAGPTRFVRGTDNLIIAFRDPAAAEAFVQKDLHASELRYGAPSDLRRAAVRGMVGDSGPIACGPLLGVWLLLIEAGVSDSIEGETAAELALDEVQHRLAVCTSESFDGEPTVVFNREDRRLLVATLRNGIVCLEQQIALR
jgi:hypothetical protein